MQTVNCLLPLFLSHLVNDTEEVGPLQTVDISNPDITQWILRDLEPVSKYKFYLRSCTTVGCGPVVSDECTTTLETSEWLEGPESKWLGGVRLDGLVGVWMGERACREHRRALRRRNGSAQIQAERTRWQSHFTISKWHWTSRIWYMLGQPSFSYLHVSNFCG